MINREDTHLDRADEVFHRNVGILISQYALDEISGSAQLDILSLASAVNENWLDLKRSVQSPIEAIMAAELMFADDGYGGIEYNNTSVAGVSPFRPTLYSQKKFLGYTSDFCIFTRYGDLQHVLVIECDGHQFHEKTREQAQHDKARDRRMVGEGYRVLRFTGSEIFRNSSGCAAEVSAMLRRLSDDIGARAGLFGRSEGESLP